MDTDTPASERAEGSESLPGTKLLSQGRIESKSLMLIYRGIHIEKSDYKSKIKAIFSNELRRDIEAMRVSHKRYLSDTNSYRVTYVIICLFQPVRTRRIELLDWQDTQAEIRILKNAKQVSDAISYLDTWTWDMNTVSKTKPALVPIEQSTIIELPKQQHPKVEIMYTSDRELKFYISNFAAWQVEVLCKMNEYANPAYRLKPPIWASINPDHKPEYPEVIKARGLANRCIHVIYSGKDYNCNNVAGVTVFLQALKYPGVNSDKNVRLYKFRDHNPNRFLVIVGMPDHRDFLEEADNQRKKGWTGECVILDCTHQADLSHTIRTVEVAADEQTYRSVWMFTKKVPDIEALDYDRWSLHRISARWWDGEVSHLMNMEWSDALSKR